MRANFYSKKGVTFRYPLNLPTSVVPLFQLFIGHCCCLVKKPLLRVVAVNHDRCNVEVVEPKRAFALKFHSLVNKPIENLINATSVDLDKIFLLCELDDVYDNINASICILANDCDVDVALVGACKGVCLRLVHLSRLPCRCELTA